MLLGGFLPLSTEPYQFFFFILFTHFIRVAGFISKYHLSYANVNRSVCLYSYSFFPSVSSFVKKINTLQMNSELWQRADFRDSGHSEISASYSEEMDNE